MADEQNILNSLRGLVTPQDNINFELSLSKHPSAYKNKSLCYAQNVRLSDDGTVLQNDNNIKGVVEINNKIKNKLIYHIIECNKELVLFAQGDKSNTFDIWRYNEEYNYFAKFYSGIPYNGGKFSGTFTYNSLDALIIAFCEYDSPNEEMNPMMTINLGTFKSGYIENKTNIWISNDNVPNDRNLSYNKLPLCPEVKLPYIENVVKVKGKSYIGVYHLYIRYKINDYDYTQWFSIGYPIINEKLNRNLIHQKVATNKENEDWNQHKLLNAYPTLYKTNLYMLANDNIDLLQQCINLDIHQDDILYDKFQIGIICISSTYTKYYRTNDLESALIYKLSLNIDNLIEEQLNIESYHNFYNVKNIINIKNKLYISNYKEYNFGNKDVDDVSVKLTKIQDIKSKYIAIDDRDIVCGSVVDSNKYRKYVYFGGAGDGFNNKKFIIPLRYYKDNDTYDVELGPAKFVSLLYYLNYLNINIDLTKSNKVKLNFSSIDNTPGSVLVKHDIDKEFDVFEYGIACVPISYTNEDRDSFLGYVDLKDSDGKNILNMKPNPYKGFAILISKLDEIPKCTNQNNIEYKNYYITPSVKDNPYINIVIYDGFKINGIDVLNRLVDTNIINTKKLTGNSSYAYGTAENEMQILPITGLVPGEIYDFYINFINKYGEISPSYRLSCKDEKYKTTFHSTVLDKDEDKNIGIVQLINKGGTSSTAYAIADIPIVNIKGNINSPNILPWCIKKIGKKPLTIENGQQYVFTDIDNDIESDVYKRINNLIQDTVNIPLEIRKTLTWGDLFDDALDVKFLPFVNSQNHKLFQVPSNIVNILSSSTNVNYNLHNGNVVNYNEETLKTSTQYGISVSIPKNIEYSSFFISYKKLEKRYKEDGFGNKYYLFNDFINTGNINVGDIILRHSINKKAWYPNFNSDKPFEIKECSLQQSDVEYSIKEIGVNLFSNICFSNDGQKNRTDRNTAIQFLNTFINPTPYIFKNENNYSYSDIEYIRTFTINKNIYVDNTSPTYRLGNILSKDDIISEGLNGVFKAHNALIYGDGYYGVTTQLSDVGNTSFGYAFLFSMYGFYDDDKNGLYLSTAAKSCNIYELNEEGNPINKIGNDIFYDTIASLNLFNYKIGNIQETNPNIYNIYNSSIHSLNEYNRTIYRSDVISDESKQNNWRFFETEAYKNIEENKGNITNILLIGNYLYVHTEHSLFAFSNDNTLSMNNQQLQLGAPDIFDMEYKEQFITKLGYGGLQDKDSWICGEYGYIYYNKSNKEIIKLYGNKIEKISEPINEFIKWYNPDKVIFADDKYNNRILINFMKCEVSGNIYQDNIMISYNYKFNNLISIHKWYRNYYNNCGFDKAYNTKENLYIIQRNTKTNDLVKTIDKESYGIYDAGIYRNSIISIIFNKYYKDIKYLENVRYKIRNVNILANSDDIIRYPIAQKSIPYAGNNIRVWNDLTDTGKIIFNITNKYDRDNNHNLISVKPENNIIINQSNPEFNNPYFDLGNWNFNYLRDILNVNPDAIIQENSRIYGNYFIIEFDITSNQLVEFEDVDSIMSQDKNI